MTTVIWREWYSPETVAALTQTKTLPCEVAEVELAPGDRGEDIACALVETIRNDGEYEFFQEGGRLVILEPPELAGTYIVHVDYTPSYTAYRENDPPA